MSFTTRQMLVFVAGAAVVLTSLAIPDPIVGDLFYTGALLLIAYATIAAIYCRGSRRAYWVGFVILFAGYFCHTVWPAEIRGTFNSLRMNSQIGYGAQDIVSTRLLSYAFQGLHGSAMPPTGSMGSGMGARMGARVTQNATTMLQYSTFMTVGQTSIALLLGMLGGNIARRFAKQTIDQLKRTIGGISESPNA